MFFNFYISLPYHKTKFHYTLVMIFSILINYILYFYLLIFVFIKNHKFIISKKN